MCYRPNHSECFKLGNAVVIFALVQGSAGIGDRMQFACSCCFDRTATRPKIEASVSRVKSFSKLGYVSTGGVTSLDFRIMNSVSHSGIYLVIGCVLGSEIMDVD